MRAHGKIYIHKFPSPLSRSSQLPMLIARRGFRIHCNFARACSQPAFFVPVERREKSSLSLVPLFFAARLCHLCHYIAFSAETTLFLLRRPLSSIYICSTRDDDDDDDMPTFVTLSLSFSFLFILLVAFFRLARSPRSYTSAARARLAF